MSDTTPTPAPVIASVRIAAPPDVVFPYFTDQSLATKWIAERADLDPRPGGMFAVDVQGNPARGTSSKSTRPIASCSPGAWRARLGCRLAAAPSKWC